MKEGPGLISPIAQRDLDHEVERGKRERERGIVCYKCGARSGDDWSQCNGICPFLDLLTTSRVRSAALLYPHEELIWGDVFTALTHRVTPIESVICKEADHAIEQLRSRPVRGDLTPSEQRLWASVYGTYLASCDIEAAYHEPATRLKFIRNTAADYAETAIGKLRERRK